MDGHIPYILSELSDVTSIISYPLQCTQRIKYTCFDVSKSLLVFGATSGGLYVFNREPCSFIQLIPNKEGTIIQLKISPDERCVSFATGKGVVCVCDCGAAGGSYMKSPLLQVSKEHQGNEVTSMVWNSQSNELYIGDDTGAISVLYLSKFMGKNVFQMPAFSLMHLDSRIVQLDLKDNMLLVSTMTRSYICDTTREQYRQIGQKLRDGEFGSCFFYSSNEEVLNDVVKPQVNGEHQKQDRTFNVVADDEKIENCDEFNYLKVFAARPGSRVWEVKIDGTVICTHQFKQLLAIPPATVVTLNDFEAQNLIPDFNVTPPSPQSLNFPKLHLLQKKFIFTWRKDGLFIFDPKIPTVVLWSDRYKDITDCKVVDAYVYLWMGNGSVVTVYFSTVEMFLLKCFVNQKYKLCAQVCSLHVESIVESIPISKKIHLISGLGEKLQECSEGDLFSKISPVLDGISKIKRNNGQKLKSGIFVVDNSFLAKVASQEEDDLFEDKPKDEQSKTSSDDSDSMLFQISPDAMQAIKGFGNTVTDKLTSGKKSLKKTWDNLEDKMKKIGLESNNCDPLDVRTNKPEDTEITFIDSNDDNEEEEILANRTCNLKKQSASVLETSPKTQIITKTIYYNVKLCDVNKLDNGDTIYSLLKDITCDIKYIYRLVKDVEEYMVTLGDSVEYAAYQSGNVFLQYISKVPNVSETIDIIIDDAEICPYFLRAFVTINSSSNKNRSCACGYPLPTSYPCQTPLFSDIIDVFIEKRWSSSQSEQCYDICKKVPYMWRKILFLRRNEDLLNLLLLILQILDEELLHFYLPKFTEVTWEKAINLLVTLRKYECLNCGSKFEYSNMLENSNILSWDCIGSLMIKSVGCANATKILMKFSALIPPGALSLKFYHSCVLIKLFEKYDGTVSTKLVDTIYSAYNYDDAIIELTKHLNVCLKGDLPHTSLPLAVASKSPHWGLKVVPKPPEAGWETSSGETIPENQPDLIQNILDRNASTSAVRKTTKYEIGMTIEQTLGYICEICPNKDCHHCGLPLSSRVLVADGGLWVFSCGHTFHGVCLTILKIKLCPLCFKSTR